MIALRRGDTTVPIPAGEDTVITLRRAVAEVYGLDHYYPGQRSFLPRLIPTEGPGVLDSLDVVADFLIAAHRREDWTQMILGHADGSGSSGKNDEITAGRAGSLHAFIAGDRQAWISGLAEDDATVATRVFFSWVADRFGWDVDTGVDAGWSARCAAALEAFRAEASDHLGAPMGNGDAMTSEDWSASFDLMNEGLVASLRGDADALGRLRGSYNVADSCRLSCGEHFPGELAGDPEATRRVELVLLEDERALSDDTTQARGLYDSGWVRRQPVEPEPRFELRLAVRAADGFPIPGVPYALDIDGFTTRGKSTRDGAMLSPRVAATEFVADLHDPQVLAAHDLAKRIHASVEVAEPAGIVPPLSEGVAIASVVAETYAALFGTELADDVVNASGGSELEPLLLALLAKCGLRPDERFIFHRFGPTGEGA